MEMNLLVKRMAMGIGVTLFISIGLLYKMNHDKKKKNELLTIVDNLSTVK
jgi:hypothetical protein